MLKGMRLFGSTARCTPSKPCLRNKNTHPDVQKATRDPLEAVDALTGAANNLRRERLSA